MQPTPAPQFLPLSWRLLQRAAATLLLLVLSPLLLAVALAVRATSPGPALFSQSRPGAGRTPFRVFKFRTMTLGSDAIESLQLGVSRGEPRVTRVGKVLRELKIDELPQLYNVVRGQMNLVGPRPIGPALDRLLTEQIPLFHLRYTVPPGLTSLGQICIDDNDADILQDWTLRSQAECHYIDNLSPRYDLIILTLTAAFLLRRLTSNVPRRQPPPPALTSA